MDNMMIIIVMMMIIIKKAAAAEIIICSSSGAVSGSTRYCYGGNFVIAACELAGCPRPRQ